MPNEFINLHPFLLKIVNYHVLILFKLSLPWWLSGKECACQCKRCSFNPWVWKIPWRREWLPTPVLLPGKSHGQRSMAGYSPWVCRRVGHNLVTKQQIESYDCGRMIVTNMSVYESVQFSHSVMSDSL